MKGIRVDEPEHTRWWRYIESIIAARNLNFRQFALQVDISPATARVWREDGATPGIEVIRRVSAVFERPMSEVLVNAGYVSWEELSLSPAQISPAQLEELPNETLLAEVKRRMAAHTPAAAENAAHSAPRRGGTALAVKEDGKKTAAEGKTTTPPPRATGRRF